jgi:uncharacterized protein (UPF0332 family)
MDDVRALLQKAQESLAGAESECANRRFNNCANRSYYACFQAAVAALRANGVQPRGGRWSHSALQAVFNEHLVLRRKALPSDLRDSLSRNLELRHSADYETDPISEISAARALRRARTFVAAVAGEVEKRR